MENKLSEEKEMNEDLDSSIEIIENKNDENISEDGGDLDLNENEIQEEEQDELDLNHEIEIIDDDIDLPELVSIDASQPQPYQLPSYNSVNGFFIPFDADGQVINSDELQNNVNELWGTNFIQFHFPIFSNEILDALVIVENAHVENNGNVLYSNFHENKVMKRVKDALLRCKNVEDPLVLEVPKGTKDSILQLDDFITDDEAYVLDDCLNNFYLYETLDQMFKIQKTDLNPFSQTPIQRIMKVKLIVT